jgi:hypothetical protein
LTFGGLKPAAFTGNDSQPWICLSTNEPYPEAIYTIGGEWIASLIDGRISAT